MIGTITAISSDESECVVVVINVNGIAVVEAVVADPANNAKVVNVEDNDDSSSEDEIVDAEVEVLEENNA